MVLTREELIASLQHEVQILVHLASKVDKTKLDYRPTPKQRSTLELLQYMAIMGPVQVSMIKAGIFTRAAFSAAWSPAETAAKAMNFDQDQVLFVSLGRADGRGDRVITALGLPYTRMDSPCYVV